MPRRDIFNTEIKPLVSYLRYWKKQGFRYGHINPREAKKRLAILNEVIGNLIEMRVEIEKRSHLATLSAPPERRSKAVEFAQNGYVSLEANAYRYEQ